MRSLALALTSLFFLLAIERADAEPAIIDVALINTQECDPNAPAFQALDDLHDPFAQMSLARCTSVKTLDPISAQRFVAVPTGDLIFRFSISLDESSRRSDPYDGTALHATFKITVTVRGPNGQVVSNTGTAQLFGSMATDAPLPGLVATPGGFVMVNLGIPITVDWAESTVSYKVELTQGLGTDEPNWESCVLPRQRLYCTYPLWLNTMVSDGDDLSSINAPLTLPAAISNTEFAVFVFPSLKFQLPVLPVAIVYAPLGNGPNALSTYQVTTATGDSVQIGNANKVKTTLTTDDKTTYNGSVKVSDVEDKFGNGYVTLEGVWDRNDEISNEISGGSSGQIVNASELNTKWQVPATTTLPLDRIDLFTQPFWSDLVLGVINPQFTLWDYPGGHLIQPLGSLTTFGITIRQLDECRWNKDAQTPTPTNSNMSHFVPFAASPDDHTTHWLWLSSEDCLHIASLDRYWGQLTQSTTPDAFRKINGGSAVLAGGNSLTFDSKQNTQLVASQTQGSEMSEKISAVQTSTSTTGGQASAALEDLFVKITGTFSGSWSYTKTTAHETAVTFTASNSQTLQSTTEASMTIQDSSGLTVPYNALQDTVFQGIAVQDTDMHYDTTPYCLQHEPIRALCLRPDLRHLEAGSSATPHIEFLTALQRPAWMQQLRTVEWDDFASPVRQDRRFIVHSPYGTYIIERPNVEQTRKQLMALRIQAYRRHIERSIPRPAPAKVTVATEEQINKIVPLIRAPH
jgi:hypothetical protein